MTYYTVKQLANEFNVSRQAIHKQISKKEYEPFKSKQRVDNYTSLVVNEEGHQRLLKHFNKVNNVDNHIDNNNKANDGNYSKINNDKVDNRCKLVDELTSEIDYLRTQNQALLETLQHEQELHLMDQKHAKALENKVKQLESQSVDNQVDNQVENIKKEPPTKKWWQFWK